MTSLPGQGPARPALPGWTVYALALGAGLLVLEPLVLARLGQELHFLFQLT